HHCPREDSHERSVGAANAVLPIDGCDGTNHTFENLVTKFAFAPGGFCALTRLLKATLGLPGRRYRDRQSGEQCKNIPQSNRAGGRKLQTLGALNYLTLFRHQVAADFIQRNVEITERGIALPHVTVPVPGYFDISCQVIAKLAPL